MPVSYGQSEVLKLRYLSRILDTLDLDPLKVSSNTMDYILIHHFKESSRNKDLLIPINKLTDHHCYRILCLYQKLPHRHMSWYASTKKTIKYRPFLSERRETLVLHLRLKIKKRLQTLLSLSLKIVFRLEVSK